MLVFFALRLVLALPAVSRRSMSTTSLMGSWTPTSASPAWAATTMSVTWRLELHQAPGDAGVKQLTPNRPVSLDSRTAAAAGLAVETHRRRRVDACHPAPLHA